MLDPSTWGSNEGNSVVKIDYDTFIEANARFFDASSFDVIRTFMGADASHYSLQNARESGFGNNITITKNDGTTVQTMDVLERIDIAERFGVSLTLDKYDIAALYGYDYIGINMQHPEYDVDSEDYAERAYIWGSQAFTIGDDARFIIHPDGSREIIDFYIDVIGHEDNFDFIGGGLSQLGNIFLEPVIDPSGIGNTVVFEFTGERKKESMDEESFNNYYDNNNYDPDPNPADLLFAINKLVKKLFDNGDGPIAFLDDTGRPIIYCGEEGSTISGTVTNTQVDIAEGLFGILNNELSKYVKNGVVYVGGAGIDNIEGTNNADLIYGMGGGDILIGGGGNDILYGGADSATDDGATDILDGGAGDDRYYANSGDVIIDSNGDGHIYFDGIRLAGGVRVAGTSGAFIDEANGIEYILGVDGTLTVVKGDKSLTIEAGANNGTLDDVRKNEQMNQLIAATWNRG